MKTKINIIVLFFVLIIGFLFAETILWLIFPVPESEVGFRVVIQNNIPGLKQQVIYDRNPFGFRSISMRTVNKPPGTIRIICMGASTTDQPTQRTEDIWSAILERELQNEFSQKNIKIEVAAIGYGGETAVGRLFWAQKDLLKFQPDLVITLEGINDMCWHGGPKYNYTTLADALEDSRNKYNENRNPSSWKALLRRFSQIYRRLVLLKHRYDLYVKVQKGRALEWHSKTLPNLRKMYQELPYIEEFQRKPDPIIEFSDALSALLKFLKESNVHVIVCGQPVLWKANMTPDELSVMWFAINTPDGWRRTNTLWLEKEMSRYNDIQREIAHSFEIPYIDLDQKIPKNLQYFFDDCHFTDLGNVKVANVIFPIAKKQIEEIIKSRYSK